MSQYPWRVKDIPVKGNTSFNILIKQWEDMRQYKKEDIILQSPYQVHTGVGNIAQMVNHHRIVT